MHHSLVLVVEGLGVLFKCSEVGIFLAVDQVCELILNYISILLNYSHDDGFKFLLDIWESISDAVQGEHAASNC